MKLTKKSIKKIAVGIGITCLAGGTVIINETIPSISNSKAEIHFIDTGNSDAILILGEKNILIDGGDNNDEEFLVSYIKNENIDTLDYIIVTHPHADHIGGLDNVIDEINVKKIYMPSRVHETKTYNDLIESIKNKNMLTEVPLENDEIKLGDFSYMRIYNTNGGHDINDESLVTLFVNGEDKFLFTGDAHSETEIEILDLLEDVDVLKVGHHGSKTSTSDELLDIVLPEYAVITVGEGNRYKHPNKVTMDKLNERNIEVHRSDECGDIIFTSTGEGVFTECEDGSYNYRD
ncbi:ComEC/Rec2 family competence protein [uncultured Clostridium sp.]|jgi:beta-lactamase superfamily II metal-dependent hydrolase|uniref:ComEC/Rec2 family competence protein n=1 Tax=uncultured Clostridium sp. TaxID=59620 RepID=UPI00263391F8|nr:ComEC/Rec2 family competence protein [uncultured Clostridium sp.]